MALSAKVIDFVRLYLLNDPYKVSAIREVPIVQDEARRRLVWILVDVIDALGIEARCPAFDAVDLVALFQEEFGEVGAVLAGDAGNECFFQGVRLRLGPADCVHDERQLAEGAQILR